MKSNRRPLLLTAAWLCLSTAILCKHYTAAASPPPPPPPPLSPSSSSSSSSFCRSDCGAGIRISYPFGIDHGCGNPNFQGLFTCGAQGTLNLTTPSGPYQVESVFDSNRTLILSIRDPQSPQNSAYCYRFLAGNFSLPASGPLSVMNTTFMLMNCPRNSSILASEQHFCNFSNQMLLGDWRACGPGYGGPLMTFQTSCVHQSNPIERIDSTYLECPSLKFISMYNFNESSEDAGNWKYGIQLTWHDPPETGLCNDCKASKGTCGYNPDSAAKPFICICAQENTTSNCESLSATSPTSGQGNKSQRVRAMVLGIILPAVVCIIVAFLGIWWKSIYKKSDDDASSCPFTADGVVQRFSYKQLVAATSNFKFEVGRGGYGVVYKGILPASGEVVAVKVLDGSEQVNEQSFQSEIATLGSINHVNLVKLYGYCSEGSKRLLVFEYMDNLSLDKYIFSGANRSGGVNLNWEKRFSVVLDAAHALEYLHEGSRQHILHCDIKPENILLDADFRAKVADFGLAKLMGRGEESHFENNSRVRGTYGYMAPEWLQGGGAITKKTDVYSFGMMVLEVVSGRRNNVDTAELSFRDRFQQKVQRQAEQDDHQVLDLIDQRLKMRDAFTTVYERQVWMLVQVALWCTQEHPSQRPTMNHVVKMMEGTLQIPSLSNG